MNLQDLTAAIRRRSTHRGISTAGPFLRELSACLGGVCPSKVLADVSAGAWAALVKEAEGRLVYHADDMAIGACGAGLLPNEQRSGGTLPPQLPPHTIATFPAVITTTRQDRDGDVLETKGAELDPAALFLWQHLPSEPIGRLLAEGKRTKSSLMGHFAIAGTALGHDAALLAEHGALRISHGFLPDEFEPLEDQDAFGGFHVTKFKILEVSLVSVPSNPDAVITQFSREKLSHPLVKAWAGAMFAARPAVVVSGGVASHVKKKDPPTEWCIKMLKKSLGHGAAIAANPDATTLIADDANKAQGHIQDVIETMDPNDKVSGGVVRGEVVSGEVVSGQQKPAASITCHSPLDPSPTKTGRVFSAANEKKLQAAAANYKAIADDHHEAHPDVAGLATKGHECIQSLFDTQGDSGADPDDMDAYMSRGDPRVDGGGPSGAGKSGQAVSAKNAAVIRQAISHGKAIKAHVAATPGHKSMAKTAIRKLRDVLGRVETPADPDGDMAYDDGNPTPGTPAESAAGGGASFDATRQGSFDAICQEMVAAATSRFAADDDLAELRSLKRALTRAQKQVNDTISRIERQQKYDTESAALAAIGL